MKGIAIKILLIIFTMRPLLSAAQDQKQEQKQKESQYFNNSLDNINSNSIQSISFKRDEDDIFTLIKKAEALADKDPKKALEYLDQALNKSLKEGNKQGEAMSYATLGKINYKQGLYAQSSNFFLKAISVYQGLGDKAGIIDTRKNLGQAYLGSSNFEKALEQYNLALSEAIQLKKSDDMIDLKYKTGSVYEKQGKFEEALKTYQEILAMEEGRKNNPGIITANNSIGNVYLQQEKTKKALEHYEKSQELAIKDKNNQQMVESFDKIGNTYRKQKNYKEELDVRNKSVEVNKSLKDTLKLALDYLEIGKNYLEQKAPNSAILPLLEGVKLSAKTGDFEKQAEAYLALSEAYKEKGNYPMALEYYQNYVSVRDSLLIQKTENQATLVNFNEELSLKQKKIDLLEKHMTLMEEERKYSHLLIYFLSAGLIIVFGGSWMIYSNSRKRRIANQVLALKSLRSQMNPHFIFNALNSVNNYISKNDERSANKYLSDFSKLMRTVMENSQHEFISLSTELSILKLYLSLEHSRFKEKFDYELTVSEDIQSDHIEIPPMLIQPYIENSVWHGLRYRDDKGFLKVSISNGIGNVLKVTVEDNGIGRKRSQELKTANQKDKVSTGLKNTENRLKIINELYSTKMKVEMEDLYKETGSGTKVSIYITPAKTKVS
jgi:tetratricopeptide (TPR) repeat protein